MEANNDKLLSFMRLARKAEHEMVINTVLDLIDAAQTYKMFAGEEDTYIGKRELREAVEALREGIR